MWEKFKNSRFVMHVRNSRAVYVTILTLILALSVLVTVTAISNRAKKDQAQDGTNNAQDAEQDNDNTNSGSNQNSTGGPSAVLPDNPDGKDQNTQGGSEQTGGDSSSADAANSVPEMALPVSGIVAKGYDSTLQVYSTTMGDYRIHLGLDMTTADAAPVLAAADGVVSQIWDDTMMGKCVAISHTGDCYTIYKNLNPTLPEDIAVGSEISAGDCIGYVGQSAVLELAEEPHLHFEMTVGGLSVDPLEYFSEQAMTELSAAEDATETSATPVE
ncbi:MAG: M23 family metallopeptidase [Clostridia bacterium]|nr:M23 family metallopeptidase [Clostridia bacterium]